MKKSFLLLSAVLVTLLLGLGFSYLGSIWVGKEEGNGKMRVTARITKNVIKTCRAYSDDELRTIPLHMRQKEFCQTEAFPYTLTILLDGKKIHDQTLTPISARGDHPMHFDKEIRLNPGEYGLEANLFPGNKALPTYSFAQKINVKKRRIVFVLLDEGAGKFMMSQ